MTKYIKNTVGNSSYENIKNAVEKTDLDMTTSEIQTEERETRKAAKATKDRMRKKTYVPIVETEIPQHVIQAFKQDDYDLRWIRFRIDGEEDLRNLSRREREGYEFVTADELPKDFLDSIRIYDGKNRQGLITSGDVCLVKIDTDLRKSRVNHFKQKTDSETRAADVYNITRKGFRDVGSKSSVSVGKEPTFQ